MELNARMFAWAASAQTPVSAAAARTLRRMCVMTTSIVSAFAGMRTSPGYTSKQPARISRSDLVRGLIRCDACARMPV